ncbi:hypothetical protein ACIGEL_18080 [Rossellomorea aquimaris]
MGANQFGISRRDDSGMGIHNVIKGDDNFSEELNIFLKGIWLMKE